MTKVEITTKTKDGRQVNEVEIEKMNVFQMMKVANGVSSIVDFINANDKVGQIFKKYNQAVSEVREQYKEEYEEQKKQKIKEEDMELTDVNVASMMKTVEYARQELLSALSELLSDMPDTVMEILANATGIKKETLGRQDFDTFMDVLDAAVEVNDLQALMNRIKKSKNSFNQITKMFQSKE